MPFIYKIYNDINDKLYIGKTEDTIANRWAKHLWSCKNKPQNLKLYNAMSKYGIDKFHIVPIEECNSNQLIEREQYWIKHYNSYENGYNLTQGGDGHPIYDRDNIILLWNQGYSQKQISELVSCDRHTIARVLKNSGIPEEERLKFKKQGNASKAVLLLNKDTLEVIKEFKSTSDALRYLELDPSTHASLVSRACRNQKYTAYGYKWIFKKDYQTQTKEKF